MNKFPYADDAYLLIFSHVYRNSSVGLRYHGFMLQVKSMGLSPVSQLGSVSKPSRNEACSTPTP
jgi:hypothetical protein